MMIESNRRRQRSDRPASDDIQAAKSAVLRAWSSRLWTTT